MRYSGEHADWKLYVFGDSVFFSGYSKKDIAKMAPAPLRGLAAPVAKTSYKATGNKHGFITTYRLDASLPEILELAGKHNKRVVVRDIFSSQPRQLELFSTNDGDSPYLDPANLEQLLRDFNIRMEHLELGEITDGLIRIIAHDVAEFCNYKPGRQTSSSIIPVDTLDISPKLSIIDPPTSQLIRIGKGGFGYHCFLDVGFDLYGGCVANLDPKRELIDNDYRCEYCYALFSNGLPFLGTVFRIEPERFIRDIKQYSIDFLVNEFIGIVSTTHEEVRSSVSQQLGRRNMLPDALFSDVENIVRLVGQANGAIAQENSRLKKYNQRSSRKKRLHVPITSVTEGKVAQWVAVGDAFDRVTSYALQLLDNGMPIYLRGGQRTECFVPSVLREKYGIPDNLSIALEAIAEFGHEWNVRGVIPTKMPEYSPELAAMFREARMSVMPSIAYSKLETGILNHGYHVRKRLEEGLRFADDGVITTLYIATDITRPMSFMQRDAVVALEFYERHKDNPNLKVQLMDMRITSASQAELIGGDTWDNLKNHAPADWLEPVADSLFGPVYPNRWGLTGQTYLAAEHMHPEFKTYIGDNSGSARMCYTHGHKTECGGCFMEQLHKIK